MTTGQRITTILTSILMILAALFLLFLWDQTQLSFYLIVFIYGIILLISGIKCLIFFFTMSRNMVGGKTMLYKGILLVDIAVYILNLDDLPPLYLVLYLAGMLAFSGVVDCMNAWESKKVHGRWMLKMARGIGSILAGVFCVFRMNSMETVVIIFCGGLIYNAVIRIINALQPHAVIAIQ
ncbi:MAG: DUF308 domain-containing protein [Solobacterium sp.]|nr:DUF308 domain-containing protein [Solobacterium sp.]